MEKAKGVNCPRCGSGVTFGGQVNYRGAKRGRRRYQCLDRKECKWHGSRPIGLEIADNTGINKKRVAELVQKLRDDKREVQRFVITAAQNATDVHAPFFETLVGYCKHNAAQLIVIPYRYRNPTAWSTPKQDDDWWSKELLPFLLNVRRPLNKNILLMGDIKTQPTASNPLEGFETISGGMSAIFGHPKLEMSTIPTPDQKLPKVLLTTGSVTRPNYIPSKAGSKGAFHHTFGAVVVEIDGDKFFARRLVADRFGSFCDLNYEYRGAERVEAPVEAIVMGDWHARYTDPGVKQATFDGPGSMVSVLKPKVIVWHDFHDQDSQNHHDRDEPFINVVKRKHGLDAVERELDESMASVDAVHRPGIKFVFPFSNHPNEHLDRWIKETDWRRDPTNASFYLRTALAMVERSWLAKSGAKTIDPLVYWAERKLKCFKECTFLGPDDSFMVSGVELGMHGHLGPNGTRGSIRAFGKVGVRSFIGHGHGPGEKDGVIMVGTSSLLRIGYNHGPSNWLHAHGLLYRNGKRSLAIIIDGQWRA